LPFLDQVLIDRQIKSGETAKDNFTTGCRFGERLADLTDCDLGGKLYRITENAGADAGESDAVNIIFDRDFKRTPITGCQQFGFIVVASAPNGAYRMDDEPGGKTVAFSQFSIAGMTAVQLPAFPQKLGSRGTMNSAIDTPAAQEAGIGGINDRIDRERSDIGLFGMNRGRHDQKSLKRFR
jgi:hypothetical protein